MRFNGILMRFNGILMLRMKPVLVDRERDLAIFTAQKALIAALGITPGRLTTNTESQKSVCVFGFGDGLPVRSNVATVTRSCQMYKEIEALILRGMSGGAALEVSFDKAGKLLISDVIDGVLSFRLDAQTAYYSAVSEDILDDSASRMLKEIISGNGHP